VELAQAARVTRPSWVNLRTTLGLLLFGAALVAGNGILAASKTTVNVWVAARDLPQDKVLGPGDLEPAPVKLPARLLSGYVLTGRALEGETLTRPLHAGELVPLGWLAPEGAPAGARSITVPVEPEHAVGGDLRAGDRVDVLATFDAGDDRARTTLLARAVNVIEVVEADGVSFGEDSIVGVTLSVTPDEAARLAFAARTGQIDVVRVDGPAQGPGGSTVTSGDFR
jgi:Flp pilus assembly protein CpaB